MNVLSPMTDLEAVNRMLESIGQAPVNSIPATGISDAAKAFRQLTDAARDVQAVGYCFNSETGYTLSPTQENGAVLLPDGVLDVDSTAPTDNFVVRAHPESGQPALYDLTNHTFKFEADVTVNIVWGFPFNDLPQPAKSYIATAAARRFQAHIVSSTILDRFNAEDEDRAFLLLQRYERRCRDTNSFRRNAGLQRWTKARRF